jgi:hypothetical protein
VRTTALYALLGAIAALALGWSSACGGIAVIDGSGGASSGPDSASGSGAAAPGPGPVGPGSSSSGPTGNLCVDACNLIGACYAPAGCADGCMNVLPACESKRDAFLQCLFDQLNPAHPCDLPDVCIVPLDSFAVCLGLKPVTGVCSDEGGTCTCAITDPENNAYDTSCDAFEFSTCTCTLNGKPLGTCTTPGFEQCSPLDDCCATLFFVPGKP